MKFSEADTTGGYLIQLYEAGRIVINGREIRSSLIVAPERLIPDWRPRAAADLTSDDLIPVLELAPQILILGTGSTQVFPVPSVLIQAYRRGIGIEVMDTGAACRTYNILMSEGRRVAAALIML